MNEQGFFVYHIVTRKKMKIGSSFEGDGNLLPKEDAIPFSQKMEQAREYWKGNVNNELPELLINGEIEVVEIIDDFSSIHV